MTIINLKQALSTIILLLTVQIVILCIYICQFIKNHNYITVENDRKSHEYILYTNIQIVRIIYIASHFILQS